MSLVPLKPIALLSLLASLASAPAQAYHPTDAYRMGYDHAYREGFEEKVKGANACHVLEHPPAAPNPPAPSRDWEYNLTYHSLGSDAGHADGKAAAAALLKQGDGCFHLADWARDTWRRLRDAGSLLLAPAAANSGISDRTVRADDPASGTGSSSGSGGSAGSPH